MKTPKKTLILNGERLVDVVVIKHKPETVLVEWTESGSLKRGWLPVYELKEGNQVLSSALEFCVPYGIAWDKFTLKVEITGDKLADALHEIGVWTQADLSRNMQNSVGVLLKLLHLSVGSLVEFAQKNDSKEL